MNTLTHLMLVLFLFSTTACVGALDMGEEDEAPEIETFELPGAGGPQPEQPVDVVDEDEEEIVDEEFVEEEEEEIVEEEEEVPEEPEEPVRPEPGTVVMFEIAAGTGDQAWNTPETAVVAYVGQILLVVNNDSETHQLHVPGDGPTNHGQPMGPGGSQEFVLDSPSPLAATTRFYDHLDGGGAGFWLEVRE